jgi:hypothetical protein
MGTTAVAYLLQAQYDMQVPVSRTTMTDIIVSSDNIIGQHLRAAVLL